LEVPGYECICGNIGKVRRCSSPNYILTSLHPSALLGLHFHFPPHITSRPILLQLKSTLTMAPTKKDADKGEKEAKLTPEQSAALIMDYLRKQNRPYSATDISSNLKNRVTKAAAAKLLKDMHERNDIEGRAAGKQIVYHVIQVSFPQALHYHHRSSFITGRAR